MGRPHSDWRLYSIPPPPRWLITVLVGAVLLVVMHNAGYPAAARFDLPGGYAGRPPTTQKWPGRCWCRYHGPRGGCMKWVCRNADR